MPPRPKTPCSTSGCGTLTEGGPCPKHAGDRQRASRNEHPWLRLYETEAWRRLARQTLEEEPFCRGWPPGKVCPNRSEHADHIIPFRPDVGGAPLSRANTQGLCSSCHGIKTAEERAERSRLAAHSGSSA